MQPENLLILFLILRFVQHLIETFLSRANYQYYSDQERQNAAAKVLGISEQDMQKTFKYSQDKNRFGSFNSWVSIAITIAFLGLGGLGLVEGWAIDLASMVSGGSIITGLAFFAILGLGSSLLSLPFDYYHTFVLEEKHGFNRQTMAGFVGDRLKGLVIVSILGGGLLALILYIMEQAGSSWWVFAWITLFGFSLLTAWLYPTFLAPMFNKFSPVEEGELRDRIFSLAQKVEFKADGISIMDASKRSTHGNAYFTGVFGKKKIVLFDNLVKNMNAEEIVAVLAHELGHFKLNHVRWGLIRSFFISGFMFFLFHQGMQFGGFYQAFSMEPSTNYGGLLIFSFWFGLLGFLFQPVGSFLSRSNEFAADSFALKNVDNQKALGDALLKLREHSHAMPISHPWFSAFYHSHPPLLERLQAMSYI